MNADRIARHLADRFGFPMLQLTGGATRAVRVAAGLQLELRWVDEAQALCIAAPLGHLPADQREAGLLRLMLANLYLADGGQPHYALSPRDECVVLCRTVDGHDPEQVGQAVERVIKMAGEVRENLRQQRLLQ